MANLFLTGSGAPTSGIGEATDYYRDTVTNLIYYKDSPTNWVGVPSLIPTPDGVGTTWLYGSGEPSNSIGEPNDYYRNETNGVVYRKDGSNEWQPKGTLDFIGVYGVQWGNGLGAPANIAPLNNLPAGSFYLDVTTSDIYYKDPSLAWVLKGQLGGGGGGGGSVTVVDGLDSTSTTAALSANQGKVLNDLLVSDYATIANQRYQFVNDTTTDDPTYTVPASAVTENGRIIIELSNNSLTSIEVNAETGTGKTEGDSVNISITGTYAAQVLSADAGVTLQGDLTFSYQYETKTLIYKGSNVWKVVG